MEKTPFLLPLSIDKAPHPLIPMLGIPSLSTLPESFPLMFGLLHPSDEKRNNIPYTNRNTLSHAMYEMLEKEKKHFGNCLCV
jgi:hypothetical protein